MSCDRIVLASGSPRRRELLRLAGIETQVVPADIDEAAIEGEAPMDYVVRLARAKRDVVAQRYADGQVVLAADTTVELDGVALGKPQSAYDARATLARLSGRTHRVHTAVAVRGGDRSDELIVTTAVTFAILSRDQIDAYVASGEPFDKAGSYAIQGAGALFVAHLDGSPTNVIGLPIPETIELLRTMTVPCVDDGRAANR